LTVENPNGVINPNTGFEFRTTGERQAYLIEMIRRGLSVRGAVRQTKISNGTLANWRKNPDFLALYEEARAEAEVARMVKDDLLPVALTTFDEKEKNEFLKWYVKVSGVMSDACTKAKVRRHNCAESARPRQRCCGTRMEAARAAAPRSI
jgi:hypothetical protein